MKRKEKSVIAFVELTKTDQDISIQASPLQNDFFLPTSQSVLPAGGTHSYKDGKLSETLLFPSKDIVYIGLTTTYKIILKNDSLYQSGVFKLGTPEQYKVGEYWRKIE